MLSSSSRSCELPGLDTKEESSRNPPAITTMIMNKTTKNRILAAAGADVVNKNKKQHKRHLLRLVEKLMDVKSKIPEELLQNILVDLIPAPLHNRTPLTAAATGRVNLAEVIRNVSKTISSLRRSAVMEKDDASKAVEISEKAAFRIIETMTQKAGKFLQSHLDDRKHTEANVKAIVQVFPCALSSKDSEGFSSITYASRRKESISFVPLLAEESSRRPNISSCSAGSNIVDRRGGLVSEDAEESRGQLCALKNIVRMQKRNSSSQRSSSDDNDEETDQRCLQLLERLRASGLFVKEDIRKHKLLYWSCKPEAKARFNYIVEWDPDALIETEIRGQPMIHFLIIFQKKYRPLSAYLSNFSMMIEAGLKYHPEKLGLFFVKSRCGESVYNAACRSFCTNGKKQVWKIAHRCLEAGEADTIERMIGKVDPTTSLYPFLKAAAGGRESSSLDILYYVLRRDPVIFESIIDDEVAGRSAANRKGGLKSAETNNRLDVEKNKTGTTKKRKRQFE